MSDKIGFVCTHSMFNIDIMHGKIYEIKYWYEDTSLWNLLTTSIRFFVENMKITVLEIIKYR